MWSEIVEVSDSRVHVIVSEKIQSLNKFIGSTSRFPWRNYKKKWAAALSCIPEREKSEVVGFTTVISHRSRFLDKENLYAGSKPIRDYLQMRGWLYDDAPKWGDITVWQHKCKRVDERTEVIVDLDLFNSSVYIGGNRY